MLVLILATLLIAFFPFSGSHFFSLSHPDPLFMISHSSPTHLGMNLLALLLVWLMAHKVGEKEIRLVGVFVASSIIPLFIPLLFRQPVIGASVGIYGMIGYLLPDMVGVIPLPVSYIMLFPVILFEDCFSCNPWSKLFHIFGLTLGVLLHYMFDIRSVNLKKTALNLGLGMDHYSLLGLGYPKVVYDLPKI